MIRKDYFLRLIEQATKGIRYALMGFRQRIMRRRMKPLDDYVLPPHSYQALLDYYERTNQLARGEDLLFTWLDEGGGETAVTSGITFYQQLAGKSDTELEDGNLPRAEVEAGLNELIAS